MNRHAHSDLPSIAETQPNVSEALYSSLEDKILPPEHLIERSGYRDFVRTTDRIPRPSQQDQELDDLFASA